MYIMNVDTYPPFYWYFGVTPPQFDQHIPLC